MLRDTLVTALLVLGVTQTFAQFRRQYPGASSEQALWDQDTFIRSKDYRDLPEEQLTSERGSRFSKALQRIRESQDHIWRDSRLNTMVFLRQMMTHPVIQKRVKCNTTHITIQTILEYLRSGRICGFRVTTVRFGLGGRR